MATAWEICLKLGFIDGETCSRGSSHTLLHDVEEFAKTWEMSDARTGTSDEINRVTELYVHWRGAGTSHWGKPLSNGYFNLLEWPKDTVKIIDLLKELFSLVLKKQRSGMNTTLAAYNRDANTFAISMPPAIPQTSVKVEEAESYVHAEDNAAQLATSSDELHSTPCPFVPASASNEPAPLIASSEEVLRDVLTTSIKEHPNATIGSLNRSFEAMQRLVEESIARPIFITHNQETVQIKRFQIDEKRLGWILKRADGSCMFMKVWSSNGKAIRYHIWLGGGLGFTPEIHARKERLLLQSIESKDLDKTTTKQDAVDSSGPYGLPQLPRTPPVTPAVNLKSARERVMWDSHSPANLRTSSPEMVSHTPQSACLPAIKTPDSVKAAKQIRGKSLVKARLYNLRKAAPKSYKLRPKSKNSTPKRRLLSAPNPQKNAHKFSVAAPLPSAPEPHSNRPRPSFNKDVIFQFFLAEEQHGAVPQTLENCETMSSFFDEALAAWGALSKEEHQPHMAAVKVIIQGVSLPIVVFWRNKEGFERMMSTVLQQAAGKQTTLSVEVHCFQRG